MPIPLPEAHVVPAVPEKTFPELWVHDFNARAASPTEGSLYVNLIPINPETGELAHAAAQEIRMDLWEAIANVPEAAAAMQAVFDAVPAVQAYLAAKEAALTQAEEPADEPVAEEPAPEEPQP